VLELPRSSLKANCPQSRLFVQVESYPRKSVNAAAFQDSAGAPILALSTGDLDFDQFEKPSTYPPGLTLIDLNPEYRRKPRVALAVGLLGRRAAQALRLSR
jgi:hypothetical protein